MLTFTLKHPIIKLFFIVLYIKNSFAQCWNIKKKNILNFFFLQISFLAIVLWCIRKVSAKKKKILIWRSLRFFENENFAARARRNLPIFWNLTHNNIPVRKKPVAFQKSQKVPNPIVQYSTVQSARARDVQGKHSDKSWSRCTWCTESWSRNHRINHAEIP